MYLLVRKGMRRLPDCTLTNDGREPEVRPSSAVALPSRRSELVLRVEDAEEDDVGGVGRLRADVGHADNDVASLLIAFPSGLGDVGAVGREGASSSTISGFAIFEQRRWKWKGTLGGESCERLGTNLSKIAVQYAWEAFVRKVRARSCNPRGTAAQNTVWAVCICSDVAKSVSKNLYDACLTQKSATRESDKKER